MFDSTDYGPIFNRQHSNGLSQIKKQNQKVKLFSAQDDCNLRPEGLQSHFELEHTDCDDKADSIWDIIAIATSAERTTTCDNVHCAER